MPEATEKPPRPTKIEVARNKLALRLLVASVYANSADADAETAVARAFDLANAFTARCLQDGNVADAETDGSDDAKDQQAAA